MNLQNRMGGSIPSSHTQNLYPKDGAFGKPCLCPLPKGGGVDENGENDELALQPVKQGPCCSDPVKTTKATKMARVTRAKAWFTEDREILFPDTRLPGQSFVLHEL